MKRFLAVFLALVMLLSLTACNFIGSQQRFDSSGIMTGFIPNKINEVTKLKIKGNFTDKPLFNGCYNALNSKQKKLYEIFCVAAEKMTEGFISLGKEYDGIENDIAISYNAFLYDRVDVFWMPGTYIIGIAGDDKLIAFEYSDDKMESHYPVTKSERDDMRKQFDAKLQNILELSSKKENDYEKEKLFNDYICQNTKYDKGAEFSNTAYGCLVLNNALCEGYAKAFKLLCNKEKIKCELIVGESRDVGHMWNAVEIDGEYYYTDVTWNDQNENPTYVYFNVNETEALKDRTFALMFDEMQKEQLTQSATFNFQKFSCNADKNNYFVKNDLVLGMDYSDKAKAIIEADSKKGMTSSSFVLGPQDLQEMFQKDDMGFIRIIQKKLKNITVESYIIERNVLTLVYKVSD